MSHSLSPRSAPMIACMAFLLCLFPSKGLAGFVDCTSDPPASVQAQIDSGDNHITVNGQCAESVFLPRDGMSISGASGPDSDAILGQVIIFSVQQIALRELTVGGPVFVNKGAAANFDGVVISGFGNLNVTDNSIAHLFNGSSVEGNVDSVFVNNGSALLLDDSSITGIRGGVFISEGAVAQIRHSSVTDTANGVQLFRSGTARFLNSHLGPATLDDGNVSCNPLCLFDNSHARIQGTTIEGSNFDPSIGGAVALFRDSSIVIRGAGSGITNTGTQPAIAVFHQSSLRQDGGGPVFASAGEVALALFGTAYGDVRGAALQGDATVDLRSVLRLRAPSRVDGDVRLSQGSTFDATGAPLVNGAVICADRDSRLSGEVGGLGQRKCQRFRPIGVDHDEG